MSLPIAAYIWVAYLWGSANASLILCRALKLNDVREQGSQNAGATNMMRAYGKKLAGLTFVLDALKGALVPWTTLHAHAPAWLTTVCILATLIGHCYPIFFGWRGGKGVATSLGCLVVLSPLLTGIALVTWGLIYWRTHWVSCASLGGCLMATVFSVFIAPVWTVCLICMSALMTWQHRDNLQRLRQGQELCP